MEGSGFRTMVPFFPYLDLEKNTIDYCGYGDYIERGKSFVFYDDESVFIPRDKEKYLNNKNSKYYSPTLSPGKYYCPNCKKFELSFDLLPKCWDWLMIKF